MGLGNDLKLKDINIYSLYIFKKENINIFKVIIIINFNFQYNQKRNERQRQRIKPILL